MTDQPLNNKRMTKKERQNLDSASNFQMMIDVAKTKFDCVSLMPHVVFFKEKRLEKYYPQVFSINHS